MAARTPHFKKLTPSDEIRQRYAQAQRRFQDATDPLAREVWQLVKDELEVIYQF